MDVWTEKIWYFPIGVEVAELVTFSIDVEIIILSFSIMSEKDEFSKMKL